MNNNIAVCNNQSGIYRIYNKRNGKFYIGSTSNFRKRMREHLSCLRKNTHINNHLQHAFNKHGEESFSFEIFERVEDLNDLLSVEQKVIDDLKPYEANVGYNISRCATSYRAYGEDNHHHGIPKSDEQKRKTSQALKGHIHSEVTKKKISKAVKGKNTGRNHWSYGKARSKQHRENHAASMKGKHSGSKNPSARKVLQLTTQGEVVQVFDTMKEAQISTGASSGNIVACCKRKRKTTGGFKWMYFEEYETTKALI